MQNWEYKKLGDIAEIFNGNSINADEKKAKYTDLEEGYPFIATKDVGFDNIVDYDNGIKIPFNESSFKIARSNSVFVCAEGGSAGKKVAFIEQDVCFGNKLFAIYPKDFEKINSRFIYLYVQSDSFVNSFKKLLTGIIGGVSQKKFANIEIPLPPLEEQKRIVKILDEKFAMLETVKANAKANLQNAKDLFQSQLTKVFSNTTWEKKVLLKDIAKDFSRGKSKHRPRNDKCLFGGNYPFIQTGDIRNTEKYITEYVDTYNETGLAQSKLWPEGTLCITIAANIAETAILTFPCCFPDSVIGFVPNEDITTADYVFYLLQFFKAELQVLGKGAAQDNINLGTFEKMEFPLPPLPEQKHIVEQLDSLSEKTKALQNIYKKILLDCDELKQSLLAKAFAGEL